MRQHFPLNPFGVEDAGQMPWIDGVPQTGTQGSFPGHAIVTDAEAEILAAIDGGGLLRSGFDLTQLLQTIARGLWLGVFGGSATALTATLPNSLVLPSLQAGMRVRGIAASNFTGSGGTLAITGIGAAGNTVSYPIVSYDGVTALASGAWVAGQFLTFDIDASGNARFGGSGSGSAGSGSLTGLTPTQRFQVVLASGTVPIFSTAMKAWLVGGGGGGNTSLGGGAGASLIGYLTGLTVGRNLTAQIGAGGLGSSSSTGGSNGGDTVLSSGTQTISTLTAGAGKAPVAGSGYAGLGGTASGGQLAMQGNGGSTGIGGIANPFAPFGDGGSTALNGVVINGATQANQAGAQGVIVLEAA